MAVHQHFLDLEHALTKQGYIKTHNPQSQLEYSIASTGKKTGQGIISMGQISMYQKMILFLRDAFPGWKFFKNKKKQREIFVQMPKEKSAPIVKTPAHEEAKTSPVVNPCPESIQPETEVSADGYVEQEHFVDTLLASVTVRSSRDSHAEVKEYEVNDEKTACLHLETQGIVFISEGRQFLVSLAIPRHLLSVVETLSPVEEEARKIKDQYASLRFILEHRIPKKGFLTLCNVSQNFRHGVRANFDCKESALRYQQELESKFGFTSEMKNLGSEFFLMVSLGREVLLPNSDDILLAKRQYVMREFKSRQLPIKVVPVNAKDLSLGAYFSPVDESRRSEMIEVFASMGIQLEEPVRNLHKGTKSVKILFQNVQISAESLSALLSSVDRRFGVSKTRKKNQNTQTVKSSSPASPASVPQPEPVQSTIKHEASTPQTKTSDHENLMRQIFEQMPKMSDSVREVTDSILLALVKLSSQNQPTDENTLVLSAFMKLLNTCMVVRNADISFRLADGVVELDVVHGTGVIRVDKIPQLCKLNAMQMLVETQK